MLKFTVSCLTFVGYTVCSIIPRYEIQGTSVLLECIIASQEGAINDWRGPFEGGTLYAESGYINKLLPDDLRNRLFITGNQSEGQSDLRIVNAQLGDEGLYNCSGTTTYNLTFPALLTSTDATYNRYILIDSELQKLFVGQMNKLTITELSNVAYPVNSTNVDFPAEADKINYCQLSKPTIPYCQNHIRFITKKTEDTLFLCGTNADSPKGFALNITDMTYTSSSVPCSNDPFDNFTAIYVKSGNQNGEKLMYYTSTLHTESSIQRPIPGTTDYMKGVISDKWMKDPQFVGSFEVGDRVFIFFRETAVETDPAEKKIYSRVAKVCKKDIGGNSLLRNKWTSFQKARLDCFIPGNLPVCFDSIQDVTMRDNVFYGLFTTTTGLPASAICAFNLTSIDAVLDGSFTEQSSPNAFWTEVTTVPTPRPGQCTNDSMSLSDSVLQFIADHPLMYQKVQPMYGKAIFVSDNEELQQLELDSNLTYIVFYAASNTGKVYKLFSKNGSTYISSTHVPLYNSDVIWALEHNEDSVFIGTDSSVTRIRVINCEKHYWIDECVKDPHCGWDNVTELHELQFFNRCRTIEYLKENDLLNKVGVHTHENYDLSFITPRSGPPNKPIYLRSTKSTLNDIELRWVSGSYDCTDHTYIISYRHAQEESSEKLIEFQHNSAYTDPQIHKISDLQSSCSYEIKLSARNDIGYSQETAVIIVSTISSESTGIDSNMNKQFDTPLEIVAAAVAIMSICSLLFLLYFKRKYLKKLGKQCKLKSLSFACSEIKVDPNHANKHEKD